MTFDRFRYSANWRQIRESIFAPGNLENPMIRRLVFLSIALLATVVMADPVKHAVTILVGKDTRGWDIYIRSARRMPDGIWLVRSLSDLVEIKHTAEGPAVAIDCKNKSYLHARDEHDLADYRRVGIEWQGWGDDEDVSLIAQYICKNGTPEYPVAGKR